jgi:glycine/betaine/sarcosine/D-proline reductase family selenoprotein B
MKADQYATSHAGFDNHHINADPNRAVPLDVLRTLDATGAIGDLHESYIVTTGNQMPMLEAERIGREIAQTLRNQRIHAVLVTST